MSGKILARDDQLTNSYCKDTQIMAIKNARSYLGDKLVCTAPLLWILDSAAGPLLKGRFLMLMVMSLKVCTRQVKQQVLVVASTATHLLEGTFLGGCLFIGQVVGRAIAGPK